jgi:hypothetical protein
MKKVQYFSHDYNASQDPKLLEVLMTMGAEGLGVFWYIIEMLYQQGGVLEKKVIKTIAFTLHTEEWKVKSIVEDFQLFESNDYQFWSESVFIRLKKRQEVSEVKRNAVLTRWNKQKGIPQAEQIVPIQIESNYLDELSEDKAWQEMVAMKYKLKDIDEVIHWLIKFKVDISINSTQHRNLADAKSHFNNWLRIQIDKQNKENYGSNKTRTEVEQRLLFSTHREDEHF